jgi:dipeptidyl aminopeptidase/acylaminoacyl peptidase
MKKWFTGLSFILLIAAGYLFSKNGFFEGQLRQESLFSQNDEGGPEMSPHPLSIETLRQAQYPGSDIEIEQTLTPGSNYQRYIASYKSEGLKIYGLLTVPNSVNDEGWPAIIFNHGYINPDEYRTTEKYAAYQDAFAKNGYVTFKSDYRGHGNSEGEARGGYGSNDYTIDVLNALASVKKYDGVDKERIGMWGHSMGGHITLESMVVSDEIKAGVTWAGVVGSYEDLLISWRPWWIRRGLPSPAQDPENPRRRSWRNRLSEIYGAPDENPDFWNSISPTSYLDEISGPVQLHHATTDNHVPYELSEKLNERLLNEGQEVEFFTYEGDDHNLSNNLTLALNRSVEFFDKYLK